MLTVAVRAAGPVAALVAALLAVPSTATGPVAPAPPPAPLPVDAAWDYQLGGARPVPAGVQVVVRDRREVPAGTYPVCYVNGFQTQPDEAAFWRAHRRRSLVLRTASGQPVVDTSWGERLLDLRTAARRQRLARIMGRWMGRCARDGFVAVEVDNLDSWTRSRGLLRRRHTRAYARLLTRAAHHAGLAVAQKNAAGLLGHELGFDFAVVEECGRYEECEPFVAAYDGRVLLVEYRTEDFARACRAVGARVAVVLRDVGLSPNGPFRSC